MSTSNYHRLKHIQRKMVAAEEEVGESRGENRPLSAPVGADTFSLWETFKSFCLDAEQGRDQAGAFV